MVDIHLNEAAIRLIIGALLVEQHDEWATQRRYMPLETMTPIGGAIPVRLPSTTACYGSQLYAGHHQGAAATLRVER